MTDMNAIPDSGPSGTAQEVFRGTCSLDQSIEGHPVEWGVPISEGTTVTIPCMRVGSQACMYSCTVRFGKDNTIEEVVGRSGSPDCL